MTRAACRRAGGHPVAQKLRYLPSSGTAEFRVALHCNGTPPDRCSRVSPLGDFELRIEGGGSLIHASLRTLQGPLQLDGEGSWASGGAPVFVAIARASPQYQQQLAPLLGLIAVARGDNSFELQLK